MSPRSAPRNSASRPPSSKSRRRSAARACCGAAFPTKALLEHAHALKVVQHAKDWGVSLGIGAAAGRRSTWRRCRRARIASSRGLTKGVEFLFKKNKIDWIKGTARLTGNGGVDVFEGETQTLRARKEIIVATGSSPRGVPGIEIDRKRIITSDEAIGLREVPKTLVDHGQRRRRRRVRLDLQPVRQRRDDRRAAAAAGAGRGRGGFRGAREIVPQAGHHGLHRREGDAPPGRTATASISTFSSRTAARRRFAPTTCWSPPGAGR